MKTHWCNLRVDEETRKLAKEMAAKAGMPMKEYVKVSLEMGKEQNIDAFKKRKQIIFDFRM